MSVQRNMLLLENAMDSIIDTYLFKIFISKP